MHENSSILHDTIPINMISFRLMSFVCVLLFSVYSIRITTARSECKWVLSRSQRLWFIFSWWSSFIIYFMWKSFAFKNKFEIRSSFTVTKFFNSYICFISRPPQNTHALTIFICFRKKASLHFFFKYWARHACFPFLTEGHL